MPIGLTVKKLECNINGVTGVIEDQNHRDEVKVELDKVITQFSKKNFRKLSYAKF